MVLIATNWYSVAFIITDWSVAIALFKNLSGLLISSLWTVLFKNLSGLLISSLGTVQPCSQIMCRNKQSGNEATGMLPSRESTSPCLAHFHISRIYGYNGRSNTFSVAQDSIPYSVITLIFGSFPSLYQFPILITNMEGKAWESWLCPWQ